MLLFLVSVFLLLSSLYAAEASVFRKARESAIEMASPILSVLAGPAAAIEDMVGAVQDYFSVLEQNQALREENEALREWEREARALREIVGTYEALGLYSAPPVVTPVNAFIVGEANDAFAHSMIVNVGRNSAVNRGDAVVDPAGLVGRLVDVSPNASRVLLLTDVQSRIPVYVEGSFVDGIMAGRTTARPLIEFTRNDDLPLVRPGQKVFTSGAGGALPRGLAVGEILSVTNEGARVELNVNYNRTRLVRVINYEFPKMTDGAETPSGEAGEEASEPTSGTTSSNDAAANASAPRASPAPNVALTPDDG